MSHKSSFPWAAAAEIDQELAKHLDKMLIPADAVADLAASPTNAEIATAFNALLAALRASNKMDT